MFASDGYLRQNRPAEAVTYDDAGSFQKDRPARRAGDSARHQTGKRLDYFFSWSGTAHDGRVKAVFNRMGPVIVQSSPGRDISDHYGLWAKLKWVGERA